MNFLFKPLPLQMLQSVAIFRFMTKKPFEILGIRPQSSSQQIKSAYYRKAKQLHPDICKQTNAGDQFNNLKQAYEVMMAQASTKKQYQHSFDQQQKTHTQQKKYSSQNYSQFYTKSDFSRVKYEEIFDFEKAFNHWIKYGKVPRGNRFSKIFQQIYTGVQRQRYFYEDQQPQFQGEQYEDYIIYQRKWSKKVKKQQAELMKKYNIELELTVTLQQIAKTCTKEVQYTAKIQCSSCHGNHHTQKIKCKKCKGTGLFSKQKNSKMEWKSNTCSNCFGKGFIKRSNCKKCHGKSKIQVSNKQKFKVTQSIQNGSIIILKNKGHQDIRTKQFGNVIIKVNIEDHPFFKRVGYDISSNKKINISEAILGSLIQVETLRCKEKIKLKQGTEDGQVIILEGLGLKKKNGRNGDHYVTISIDYNKDYSEQQLQCFHELRQLQQKKGGR